MHWQALISDGGAPRSDAETFKKLHNFALCLMPPKTFDYIHQLRKLGGGGLAVTAYLPNGCAYKICKTTNFAGQKGVGRAT